MSDLVKSFIKAAIPLSLALTLFSCDKDIAYESQKTEAPIVVNYEAITVRESGVFSPAKICDAALKEAQEGHSEEDEVKVDFYKMLLENLYSANLHATKDYIDAHGGNSIWDTLKGGWDVFNQWMEESISNGKTAVKEAWSQVLMAYEWLRMGYAILEYPSTSADGTPVTLSMLVCWPKRVGLPDPNPNTLVIGNHVTRCRYDEVPSYFNSLGLATDAHLLATTWATSAYLLPDVMDGFRELAGTPREALLVMPDYEGYGSSLYRTQPYLNREVQARQSLEAALYAKKWFEETQKKEFTRDYKTIAIGYSQGGAVSAATYRYALENGYADDLNFVGAVCGDGPYEPEETLRTYIENDYLSMPVSIALVLKGLCETDPEMIKVGAKPQDFCTEAFFNCGIFEMIQSKLFTADEIGNAAYAYESKHPGSFKWITISDLYGKKKRLCTSTVANQATMDFFSEGKEPADKTLADKLRTLRHCLRKNGLTYGPNGTWTPPSDAKFTFFHASNDDVVPFENMTAVRDRWGTGKARYIRYSTNATTHGTVGGTFFIFYSFKEALNMLEGDWEPGETMVSGGLF